MGCYPGGNLSLLYLLSDIYRGRGGIKKNKKQKVCLSGKMIVNVRFAAGSVQYVHMQAAASEQDGRARLGNDQLCLETDYWCYCRCY